MGSKEISARIAQLEKEKTDLERILKETIEKEERERKKKMIDDSRSFILRLWELYWKDDDNAEALKRLDKCRDQCGLNAWIEEDVKAALKNTGLASLEQVRSLVKEYGVECDVDKCAEDAATRLDFAAALRGVRHGRDLSARLGYGFDSGDLMELMRIHAANRFRKKIEELLTDCNFHEESSLLSEGKYDQYREYVL